MLPSGDEKKIALVPRLSTPQLSHRVMKSQRLDCALVRKTRV